MAELNDKGIAWASKGVLGWVKAVDYFTKAIEQGNDRAYHNLGKLYLDSGDARGHKMLMELCSEESYIGGVANHTLGYHYHKKNDLTNAYLHYSEARRLGIPVSAYNLGCIVHAMGIKKNDQVLINYAYYLWAYAERSGVREAGDTILRIIRGKFTADQLNELDSFWL